MITQETTDRGSVLAPVAYMGDEPEPRDWDRAWEDGLQVIRNMGGQLLGPPTVIDIGSPDCGWGPHPALLFPMGREAR